MQAEYPDARAGRPRYRRIVEGVVWYAVAARSIDPQDFAGQRVHKLRTERADVFGGHHQTCHESLLILRGGVAARVFIAHACTITATGQERPVAAECETARTVRGVGYDTASGRTAPGGLPQQHSAARIIHRIRAAKILLARGPDDLVADQAPYRRAARGVLARAVRGAADRSTGPGRVTIGKVLRLDGVEKIDVAVPRKVRVEREARQAQRADGADFVREVNERLTAGGRVGVKPDPPSALPYEHAAAVRECNSGGTVPRPPVGPVHRHIGKASRNGTCPRRVASRNKHDECQDPQADASIVVGHAQSVLRHGL